MKRSILIVILCAIGLFSASCSSEVSEPEKGTKPVTEVTSSEDSSENESDESYDGFTSMPDDWYVEYAVPNFIDIPDNTIAKINSMLAEKGYGFGLKILQLDFDNYSEELKESSPDIAFIGFNENGSDSVTKIIASGYFEELNDCLPGSKMYSQISTKLWDSVKYGDKIYTVPNCSALNIPVSIVFNLDSIPKEKAESFTGNITEIPEILGDGTLLYQLQGFEFSEYYGYDYSKGVLVSQEKEVELPYNSKKCIEWLKTINGLYLNDQVTESENQKWDICITKDIGRLTSSNVFVYSTKSVVCTRYSASTGILAASDNKGNAFKLLDLLHSDRELANCLIYGTEYQEKDGFAADSDGKIMDRYVNRLIFGLDENILWSNDFVMHFNSYKEKLDYYDEKAVESPLVGKVIDTDTAAVQAILADQSAIWQANDLDGKLNELEKVYNENNAEMIVDRIKAVLN